MNSRNAWPLVVIVALMLGAIVAIQILTPDGQMAARTTLLALTGLMGPLLGAVYAVLHVKQEVAAVAAKVREVDEKVNGRMSQLIDKKTTPDDGPDYLPRHG